MLDEHLKKLNHHAYCLETGGQDILPELLLTLENNFKFKALGNPDFWHFSFGTLVWG